MPPPVAVAVKFESSHGLGPAEGVDVDEGVVVEKSVASNVLVKEDEVDGEEVEKVLFESVDVEEDEDVPVASTLVV